MKFIVVDRVCICDNSGEFWASTQTLEAVHWPNR